MDYDTDDKSMATLRRQLRRAHEEYYRCKSEYMICVMEALKLEDTIKIYERRDANGWKYVSSFRESRAGTLGSLLDTIEFDWRCVLRKQVQKHLLLALAACQLLYCWLKLPCSKWC